MPILKLCEDIHASILIVHPCLVVSRNHGVFLTGCHKSPLLPSGLILKARPGRSLVVRGQCLVSEVSCHMVASPLHTVGSLGTLVSTTRNWEIFVTGGTLQGWARLVVTVAESWHQGSCCVRLTNKRHGVPVNPGASRQQKSSPFWAGTCSFFAFHFTNSFHKAFSS